MRTDFAQMRNAYPILSVCRLLGIELKKKGTEFRGACKICNSSSNRCFTATPHLRRYYCFGGCKAEGKKGGDALQLVVEVLKVDHKKAAEFIVQGLGR